MNPQATDITRLIIRYGLNPLYKLDPSVVQFSKIYGCEIYDVYRVCCNDPKIARNIVRIIKSDKFHLMTRYDRFPLKAYANPDPVLLELMLSKYPDKISRKNLIQNPNPSVIPYIKNLYQASRLQSDIENILMEKCIHLEVIKDYLKKYFRTKYINDLTCISKNKSKEILLWVMTKYPSIINYDLINMSPYAYDILKANTHLVNDGIYNNTHPEAYNLYSYASGTSDDELWEIISEFCTSLDYLMENLDKVIICNLVANPIVFDILDKLQIVCPEKAEELKHSIIAEFSEGVIHDGFYKVNQFEKFAEANKLDITDNYRSFMNFLEDYLEIATGVFIQRNPAKTINRIIEKLNI